MGQTNCQLAVPESSGAAIAVKSAATPDLEAQVLARFVEATPIPTFVINTAHVVTHWNRACEMLTGLACAQVVGTANHRRALCPLNRPVLADLLLDGALSACADAGAPANLWPSALIPGAFESEAFLAHVGPSGRWCQITAAPLVGENGCLVGALQSVLDITEAKTAAETLRQSTRELEEQKAERATELAQALGALQRDIDRRGVIEAELMRRNGELERLNVELSRAQRQLIDSYKLASIGQLAAGVAHEINNPIGYVSSNFGSLNTYLEDLFEIVGAYEEAEQHMPADLALRLAALRRKKDLDFLREDISSLMYESREGIVRVRKIVQDLKDFSRVDGTLEWQWADLHCGIESTINIVSNQLKYKADIVREYGAIPEVECLPSQINQVIMNLLVNAAHAIEGKRGTITIRTAQQGDEAWFEIEDTGAGVPEDVRSRIFDPFFTTKPVGVGTGLGLSLSYSIVQRHHGRIDLTSALGLGTTFRVTLPIKQSLSPVPGS